MINLPYLIFTCLFSLFGAAFFIYGKKAADPAFLAAGGLLMIYPYFVSGVWLILLIGLLLTVAPFIFRHFDL
jgi:hypothetical protein